MDKIVKNSIINGSINAPPSKSMTIRAIAGASLCQSESVITNYSICKDALAALDIIKATGSNVPKQELRNKIGQEIIPKQELWNKIKISGGIPKVNGTLNCGESAFCLRLFSEISAIYDIEFELIGEKTLLNRSTNNLEEILGSLGVYCKTNNGFPPITVRGPIKGGKIKFDGSKSSQLLSGLLFSLPLAPIDSIIEVINLKSKPYVDLTIDILSKFGIRINNENYKLFKIEGRQSYKPAQINIEGDWSCASNFLVAGAINGEISINNLDIDSKQGDKIILELLSDIGAEIIKKENSIKIRSNSLKPFEFNAEDYPDLVPVLTVLGSFCQGTSIISDISRLKDKESSRAEIIAKELNSIGGKVQIDNNKIKIENSSIHGGIVDSNGDHRIAMALAIAGLSSKSPVIIKNAECVDKSYPDFWKDLESVSLKKD